MNIDNVRLSIIKILPFDIDKNEVYPDTTLEELRLHDKSLKRYGWFMNRLHAIFGVYLADIEVAECKNIYDLAKKVVEVKTELQSIGR